MKKTLLTFAVLLLTGIAAWAQAPRGFNYQGVARDISGSPLANTAISLRLTMHDGIATGTVVYQESFNVTTNTFGLYNVIVGTGTVLSGGPFVWPPVALTSATDAVYMQVEVDPTGSGLSYTDLGSSQLMSVPYALYAANGPIGATGPTGPAGPKGAVGDSGRIGLQGPPGVGIDTIYVGAGLLGGTITTSGGTISMPNVGSAGTYGASNFVPVITTDAQGRVSSVVNTPIAGDNWGTQLVVTDATLKGIGTTPGPLGLAQNGATAGQLLQWSGTAWVPATVSGTGSVTSVGTTAPLSGGPITAAGTISLDPTGTAGTYGDATHIPQITTDAWGRVNTVTAIPIASTLSGSPSNLIKFTSATTGGNSSLIDSSIGLLYNTNAMVVTTVPQTSKFTYNAMPGSGLASNWFSFNGDINSYSFLAVTDSGTGNRGLILSSAQEANNIALGAGTGNAFVMVYSEASNMTSFTNGVTTAATMDMTTGDFNITGNLSKGGGTFKIDDPLDPENKYLYHSFVESPDMMNVYNGNITTDASGNATVALPGYFDVLNKEPRYQLTVIGTFAQAIVSKEESGNSFEIKTNAPNVKVSWQVTGIRKDPYANAHRVVPEVEKSAADKGKYLYPVENGKPASMGINYRIPLTNAAAKNKQ